MKEKDEQEAGYDIVTTENGSFKTHLITKFRDAKPWVKDNPKEIKSFIPGTVVELKVKEGDSIKTGDLLMIYKAMKMNNNILAQVEGRIKKIHVKEGDSLPNRTVMIELE